MKQLKKGLAMLLVAIMLISTTSISSLAEGNPVKDEVIYNLGNQEITVGYNTEQAKETSWNYKLFDKDDNYTLKLEDNAFFPYEVQFKSNGVTTVEWFETPDSIVQIDGHSFSVYSEMNDDTKLFQIGVWIDGEYIAARPEAKTFTNPMIKPISLLPLDEIDVTLDLKNYTPAELKKVKLSSILSSESIEGEPSIVWIKKSYSSDQSGEYKIAGFDDEIDLSPEYAGYTQVYLELIVGDAKQLSMANTRYIVTVELTSGYNWLDFEFYNQDDEEVRTEIDVYNSSYQSYNNEVPYFYITVDANGLAYGEEAYLGLKWGNEFASLKGDTNVTVYRGLFSDATSASTAAQSDNTIDITDKVWNRNMANVNEGNKADYTNYQNKQSFTIVLERNESIVGITSFEIYVSRSENGIQIENIYETDAGTNDYIGYQYGWSTQNDVRVITYNVYKDFDVNSQHYLRMYYLYQGSTNYSNNIYISKAVRGHYNTVEEMEIQTDIKSQLYPSTNKGGYLGDYSGTGQDFTVVDTFGKLIKYTVKAVGIESYKYLSNNPFMPNPGSSDTNFRVTGAGGLSTYILPYEHDTYYDMGYQTVFYTDDIDLSLIRPNFWQGTGVDVYSGHSGNAGIKQESGKTEVDFSNGPVQYAAAAENGEALKNYWVTFVKKHIGGAKLFVNGINGDEGAKREVLLTGVNSYSSSHDIFIANVGDIEITGLNATLTNAQNIKLDPYWTVGGENNDTLAAFDSVSWTSSYSELANVGKIRILPDGEGEIKGTLTISADGHEPVEIELTGNAGDPKLTTTDIPEAVKYVPYAVQILHNNKYSWNKVTLSVTWGTLPEGVTLKPNGELYGVPKETGTFRFQVQMTNSDTRFSNSSAYFTLIVKENTNANVNAATDPGYTVSKRLGTTIGGEDYITSYSDHLFTSEGEMGEFTGFWLNGEELEEDVDYTKEEGSTKITVKSQTFQNKADKTGTNTIAAEFRVDGNENNELKRAAQNFKIDLNKNSGGSNNSEGTGGTGNIVDTDNTDNSNKTDDKKDTEENNNKEDSKNTDNTDNNKNTDDSKTTKPIPTKEIKPTPVIKETNKINITKAGKATIDIDIPLDKAYTILAKGKAKIEISTALPKSKLVSIIKELPEEAKSIELVISIPTVKKGDEITISEITIPKNIYNAAASIGKDIQIKIVNGKDKAYTWSFNAESLKESDRKVDNHDTVINISDINAIKKSKVGKLIKKDGNNVKNNNLQGYLLSFEHDGLLPETAKVKVYVASNSSVTGIKSGKNVFLYYYNEEKGQLEQLPTTKYKVNEKGYVELDITHCSDYILLPNKLNDANVKGLLKQISFSKEMTLYTTDIIGTEESVVSKSKLDITLPMTIKVVDEFSNKDVKGIIEGKVTYKSSNENVAVVSKAGRVTAKSKGTATISITIELSDGTSRTINVNITVKKASITFIKPEENIKLGTKKKYTIKVNGFKRSAIAWKTHQKDIAVVARNEGELSATVTGRSAGTDNLVIRVNGIKVNEMKVKVK